MKMQWFLALGLSLAAACSTRAPKDIACRGIASSAGQCALASCDSETGNWEVFPVEVGAPCGSIGQCDGAGKCVLP